MHARRLLEACGWSGAPNVFGAGPAACAQLEWARSGAMALTGEPGGAPRFAPGAIASAARGAGIALESLAPGAPFAGRDWAALLGERAAIAGLTRGGRATSGGSGRLLPTRDGWIAVNLPRPDDWRSVAAWLDAPAEPAFEATNVGWSRIEDRIAALEAEPLVARARLLGLAATRAPHDVDRDAQPFRLIHASERPLADRVRAPRVLDLSSLWAGPLATALLAEAGCDVLKVESPTRPDGARSGPRAFFDLLNDRKRGAALDLRDPNDRSVFERLLDRADVVVESARPRALAQLGYGAADWVEERCGRLWLSITGYGRAHEWIAFGDEAAIAAGLAWSPGPPGVTGDGTTASGERDTLTPCFCGDAIADPLTGLHVAVIVLALLRLGRGGLVDVALRDIAAFSAARTGGPVLPIERRHSDWEVLDGAARIRVAAPRARPATGPAPSLSRPSKDLLKAWTDPSC